MAARLALTLWCLVVGCYLVACVQGGTVKCQQEGRFPHPEDCGSYVDCIRTGDGGLRPREGSCQGFAFSAKKRRCVALDEKPGCVPKGTRTSFHLSEFDFECVEDKEGSDCTNCNLAYTCVNGAALVEVCDAKSLCRVSDAFGGSVCLSIPTPIPSPNPAPCKCEKTGLFVDPYNATYFSYCDVSTTPFTLETLMCAANGAEFNEETQKCEVYTPPQTPSCRGKTGTFVNPNDCRYYYTCLPGGTVRTGSCKEGEYFIEEGKGCGKSCNLFPPQTIGDCATLGLGNWPHPYKDCTHYLVCKTASGVPQEVTCYAGYYFDEDKNKCVSEPSSDCDAGFDYSSCPGYNWRSCP